MKAGTVRALYLGGMAALLALAFAAPAGAGNITILSTPTAGGYQFVNFDGPTPNTLGTTINGIANNGTVVGFTLSASETTQNFTANPLVSTNANVLNINGLPNAMANAINSNGLVVGTDGNGNAFTLNTNTNTFTTFIPNGGTSAVALGVNDAGQIVGQYTNAAGATPGFVVSGSNTTTINAPTGATSDLVNAQGINNNGLVVGFYLGNDGQVHGFEFNLHSAVNGVGTGTAIADPTIPTNVPGEPGATFMFSQILGINDHGIAVGYYGDSTLSQHGFLYNTNTGQYTFLDDPSEGFSNGVEVTQITGITNSGEITGFYTDANGEAHGFVAFASVPEPGSVVLLGLGMAAALGYGSYKRLRKSVGSRA
jgi:hypothetical protein